jgi:hypothetical protein
MIDDPLAIEVPWTPEPKPEERKEIKLSPKIHTKAITLTPFAREGYINDLTFATRKDIVDDIALTLERKLISDIKDKYKDFPKETLDTIISTYGIKTSMEHDVTSMRRVITVTAIPKKEVLICTVPTVDSAVEEKSKEWAKIPPLLW